MSDLVLNALMRNREIAEKAGQLERARRLDARLAQLAQPERSAKKEKKEKERPVVEVWEATPEAHELADELGIDLADVEGTGEGGRILKGDVERAHGDR